MAMGGKGATTAPESAAVIGGGGSCSLQQFKVGSDVEPAGIVAGGEGEQSHSGPNCGSLFDFYWFFQKLGLQDSFSLFFKLACFIITTG